MTKRYESDEFSWRQNIRNNVRNIIAPNKRKNAEI